MIIEDFDNSLAQFIRGLPKAELHLHIEGTLEPEMLFELAARNGIPLKYASVTDLKAAYCFNRLQDFLDIYYAGTAVLVYEQDFFDLTRAYLEKAREENILHAEIFFDPQSHLARGIPFETAISGIYQAMQEAEKDHGISTRLIMCFLRHLDENDAVRTYEIALPYRRWITGVGLDSSEKGNPPGKFRRLFKRAQNDGFLTVAHAGEEGPAEYVREALEVLNVHRIDHGNHSIGDEELLHLLAERQIPLTMCPLSNLRLKVIPGLEQHPLKKLLDKGLRVTVNSDDPAYFGGYLNENYIQLSKALNLSREEILQLARNSFLASFLDDGTKTAKIRILEDYSRKEFPESNLKI